MTKGSSVNNQRILHRQQLIFYLKLVDPKTKEEIARLGDINVGGIMLLNNELLPLGTIYKVWLELPKTFQEAGISNKYLPLSFQTVWGRPGPKNSTYYEIGARFTAPLSEQHLYIIEQLTDVFSMP